MDRIDGHLGIVVGAADRYPMTLIDQYTAYQQVQGFSPRTVHRRAWSLGLWARHLADRGASVTTATVEHLMTFLARWPSAQSRYSIRSDVHQLYLFVARWHLADCEDPTEMLDPPKLPRRRATPIPAAAVRDLIDRLNGSDRLIVMLAAHAGLRVTEIANVRGEDVDLIGRWLRVIGKGNREDLIPVSHQLADELARWPRRGRLVPYRNGGCVGNRIRTLLRSHGIEGRPHDLRHSFANAAMKRSGQNLVVVKELMRHAQITTTMRYLEPPRIGHDIVDHLYDDAA
jgi:integrase/recombinase XerD